MFIVLGLFVYVITVMLTTITACILLMLDYPCILYRYPLGCSYWSRHTLDDKYKYVHMERMVKNV